MEERIILKNKFKLALLFLVSLGIFSSRLDAHIFDRFYLRIDGGGILAGDFTANNRQPDLQINDLGRSLLYGAGIGFMLCQDLRIEAKVARRIAMRYQYFSESVDVIDLTTGKLGNKTVTLGLYYDLFHLKRSTPYIGLGGGYSRNTLFSSQRLTDLDIGQASPLGSLSMNSYCFFVSTGTLIDIMPHVQMDVSGSYVNLGQVGPILPARPKLDNIAVFELTLGLVFKFL